MLIQNRRFGPAPALRAETTYRVLTTPYCALQTRSPHKRPTTAFTATAGCLGVERRESGAEQVLVFALSDAGESLRESFVVDLAQTRPDRDATAFDATLDGNSYTTQYRKPFSSSPDDPVYTRRNGTYYRLDSVVVDEVTETRPVLRLFDATGTDASTATSEPVPASELPEGDRRAIRFAYFVARARGTGGGVPWDLTERGGYVYRSEAAIDASELVSDDGPATVTYRDATYRVEIAREEFHEPVYRARVEPVAETPARMEEILRVKSVDARLSRESLSPAAREIVRTAQSAEYRETHPYSEEYRELLRALDERAYLDGDIENDALRSDSDRPMCSYGGGYYYYRLRFEPGSNRP